MTDFLDHPVFGTHRITKSKQKIQKKDMCRKIRKTFCRWYVCGGVGGTRQGGRISLIKNLCFRAKEPLLVASKQICFSLPEIIDGAVGI